MPATEQEYREISEDYAALRQEMDVLFKVGTNRPIVKKLLREASHALAEGDYRHARDQIALARSTAHSATTFFLSNWMLVIRDTLLSIRTQGGDVSASRPLLIAAKKALAEKDYKRVVVLSFNVFDTIGNMPSEYIATLKVVMKVRYNYTLVESYGLDMTWAQGLMEMAFEELNAGNLRKAVDLVENAKAEVRRINMGYKEASKLMVETREAIDESRGRGADVTQAEVLLAKATDRFEANDMKGATELLTKANDTLETVNTFDDDPETAERLMKKLDKARRQLVVALRLGVDTSVVEDMLSKAEEASAISKFELADDMIDQVLMRIPHMTMDHMNARFEGVSTLIKETRSKGIQVEGQRVLLSKAMEASAHGDLEDAMEDLDEIEVQVNTLKRGRTAMEAIERGKKMGADVSEAELLYAMGWKRQQDDEWRKALSYYSDAIDEAIAAGKAMTWKGEG